jgi:catechol 2,3-dioxygenase-like lactoylglutathione lyase family enzyme
LSEPQIERPARRFLHVCYCCDDAGEVSDFFVEHLSMKNTMRTTDQYSSGAILGIDRDVRSVGSFVYDHRGPRTSPAIEVQGWYDPAPVGEPSTDPFRIGIKALGLAVPSVSDSLARLTGAGCRVIADGPSPFATRHATLLDPRNVTLELVPDPTLGDDQSRMHHLRINVSDLDVSLPFYDTLGFEVLERSSMTDATCFGAGDDVDAEYARLRLPDEPFELWLFQWNRPAGHGEHYKEPYHRGIFRVALGVDDTRESYRVMSEKGSVFDRPVMAVELSGTPVPDMWITFISDPDHMAYEFVQRPRSAFR